ncbi:uncharacterized protein C10orf120 homolog [Antechinus flavipes]|uniref:uncharacterized protein C10orf120 homolog n=1 Tax=Antechinus flavipes TaxID=38775 RepID=UPI0022368A90|nr:uncharacterized protein C10orf120 homolog [Antechinus flavipes]
MQTLNPVANQNLYNPNDCIQEKDPLLCTDDLNQDAISSIWMKYYGSDPRIALGKHSPLEKEIMRLGGVHTIATRRLLAQKQKEEEKTLRNLRQKSLDYQKALEYKKEHPLLNTGKKSMEKIWTAKIIISREDLKVPTRERKTINKHIERMKLGRRLQEGTHSKEEETNSFLPAVIPDFKLSQKRDYYEENPKTNKTEIKMEVTFKADEPKRTIIRKANDSGPNDRQTFDLRTKTERKIAGHTNRTRMLPTDFPGDMLFLSQNYKSTRIHLTPSMKTLLLNKEGQWKNSLQYPFEESSHS